MWKAEKKEKKEKDSASDSEGMETDLKDQHDRIARAKKYQSDQMRMNVHIAEADQILEASGRMSAGITTVSGAPGFGFDPESGKPGKSPGSSSSKQLAGSKGQGKKGAR
jgi:predicted ATP-dependent serine protease